jgi:hypothetical protein
MTAAELHALVADLPDVWPEGLKYVDITPYGSPDRVMVWDLTCKALPEHSSHRSCISASLAADLILAGVVRKRVVVAPQGKNRWMAWHVAEVGTDRNLVMDETSPLHAALAAYRKVKP